MAGRCLPGKQESSSIQCLYQITATVECCSEFSVDIFRDIGKTILDLVRKKLISIKVAAEQLGMTEKDFCEKAGIQKEQ